MSLTKRLIEESEQKSDVAIEIALRVGLLAKCEFHDEVYDPQDDKYGDAYKLANSLITSHDPLADVFEGNRRGLTDYIKDITHDFGDECSFCAKWMKD